MFMATATRRWLALLFLGWCLFAFFLQSVFPLFAEHIEEIADMMGLEGLEYLASSLVFTAAVLVPLVVLLSLFASGGLQLLVRQLSPTGRALERNRAGVSLTERGGHTAALAEFTEAIRLNPRLAAAHANRGVANYQLGKMPEALADLDAALSLAPELVDALSWRGLIRARMGESELALADLDRAIALGATGALIFATRGSVLIALEDYDRALADCTEALLRGQRNAADFSNRGMAWLGKADYARASADFEEAIRLEPGEGLFFNNRGMARLKQGFYLQAQADFREAMRLTPDLPHAYKNLAWLMATCPEPQFRDAAAAVAHAQKALELVNGKMIPWLAILAAAHAEAGNFGEAVKWQAECLDQSTPKLKAEMAGRLDLYQRGQPYRELPASGKSRDAQPEHHVRVLTTSYRSAQS
jgi:tetratricopeptide (TPR) repeat protein